MQAAVPLIPPGAQHVGRNSTSAEVAGRADVDAPTSVETGLRSFQTSCVAVSTRRRGRSSCRYEIEQHHVRMHQHHEFRLRRVRIEFDAGLRLRACGVGAASAAKANTATGRVSIVLILSWSPSPVAIGAASLLRRAGIITTLLVGRGDYQPKPGVTLGCRRYLLELSDR